MNTDEQVLLLREAIDKLEDSIPCSLFSPSPVHVIVSTGIIYFKPLKWQLYLPESCKFENLCINVLTMITNGKRRKHISDPLKSVDM